MRMNHLLPETFPPFSQLLLNIRLPVYQFRITRHCGVRAWHIGRDRIDLANSEPSAFYSAMFCGLCSVIVHRGQTLTRYFRCAQHPANICCDTTKSSLHAAVPPTFVDGSKHHDGTPLQDWRRR